MDGAVAASPAIDRSTLFFWLFLIAVANKLIGVATGFVAARGLANAIFDLFGISAIVWLALIAGSTLVRGAPPEPVRRTDVAAAILVATAAILPVPSASAGALTILASYAIFTTAPASELRRGAIIFLAMTTSLIWGPLLLALFGVPMLGADAYLVARLVGTTQLGNQLAFTDGSGSFVVAAGCSSFQGMSLAVVFWATVNQWFRVPFGWGSVAWLIAALFATLGINIARIGAIAHFPEYFDALHTGTGYHVASWTTLFLVVAICLVGARREIFAAD